MTNKKKIVIIREKIEKIVEGNHKEEDIHELISSLYEILFSIVKKVRTRAVERGGYGKEDVVNIAISSLFENDKGGDFSTLKKLFSPLTGSKYSMEEFSRFFYATLHRRVKEALAKLLNEIYPFQTKVRISFFNVLKNNKELKFDKRGRDFIIWLKDSDSKSLAPVSYGTVLSESISNRLWNKKPSFFLLELLRALKSRNIDNPVYLRDVIDAYVILNPARNLGETVKSYFNFPEEKNTEKLIEDLIKKIEEENIELIDLYVKKRRISESQREAFVKAVNDIIYDWLHAEKEGSFYNYLIFYTNEIDLNSYRKDKRKILEYLVKRSRKLVKEIILAFFNGY